MTESKTEAATEAEAERVALKEWYKPLLDDVVQHMLKRKAVTGAAVEANPVWMFPYKILIAKVWGMGQKTRFIWTISGDGLVTDHIPGSMAASPKDAVRHISLKWQMDADRLLALDKGNQPVKDAQVHMGNYANKLIKDAETLYDLTQQEEIWL